MADYEVIRRGPAHETVEAKSGNIVRVWNAQGEIDRSKRTAVTADISVDNVQTKPRQRKDVDYGVLSKGTHLYDEKAQSKLARKGKKVRRTTNIREKREKAVQEFNEESLSKSMKKMSLNKKKAVESDSETEEEEEKENVENKKTETKKPVEKEAKKPETKKPEETEQPKPEPSQEVAASKTQVRTRKSAGLVKKESPKGLDSTVVKMLEGHGFKVEPVTNPRCYESRTEAIPVAIQQLLDVKYGKKVFASTKYEGQLAFVDFALPEDEVEDYPIITNKKYADKIMIIGEYGNTGVLAALNDDHASNFDVYLLDTGADVLGKPVKIADLLATATVAEKLEETINESVNESVVDEDE